MYLKNKNDITVIIREIVDKESPLSLDSYVYEFSFKGTPRVVIFKISLHTSNGFG